MKMRQVLAGLLAGNMMGPGQRASSGGKKRSVNFSLLTKYSCEPTRTFSKKPVGYPTPARRSISSRNPSTKRGTTTRAPRRKNFLRWEETGWEAAGGAEPAGEDVGGCRPGFDF